MRSVRKEARVSRVHGRRLGAGCEVKQRNFSINRSHRSNL